MVCWGWRGVCPQQGEAERRGAVTWRRGPDPGLGAQPPHPLGPSRTGGKSQTWKGDGSSRHTFASAVLLSGARSLLLTNTSHPVNTCGLYSHKHFLGGHLASRLRAGTWVWILALTFTSCKTDELSKALPIYGPCFLS